MNKTVRFDVNTIHEVAGALFTATSEMLKRGEIALEAENFQDAIQKVLRNNPEWDTIGSFITECWNELYSNR